MPYNDERVQVILVNRSTQAINPIIPSPGAGKRLAIDLIALNPSGGANVLTLGGKVIVPFGLNDNQALIIDNGIHSREGIFPLDNDQPLNMTLGSNTAVEGYLLYRIINN